MPRTTIAAQAGPAQYPTDGVAVTWVNSDVANGNQVRITGRTLLLVRNINAGAQSVTIASAADPYSRFGTITAAALASNQQKVFPMFPLLGWLQSDGYLYINGSHADVQFGVVEMP